MRRFDIVAILLAGITLILSPSTVDAAPHGLPSHSIQLLKESATQTARIAVELDYGLPLVENGIDKLGADWSPDGNWVAYEQEGDIFIIPSSGGTPLLVTGTIDDYCYLPQFTPDSNAISFTSYDSFLDTYTVIQVMFGNMQFTTKVLLNDALAHTFSSDGAFIVYRVGSTSALAVYNTINHNTRILANGDYDPSLEIGYGSSAISPDNQTVVTSMVMLDGTMKLFSIPIEGGTPTQLTDGVYENHNYPDFSPDGKWVLFTDLYYGDLLALDIESGDWFEVYPGTGYLNIYGRFSAEGKQFVYLHDILSETSVYEVYVAPFPYYDAPSYFTLGSAKNTVQQVQGEPSSVNVYGNETVWNYGSSSITFSNSTNTVIEYYESPLGPELLVFLGDKVSGETFWLNSNEDEVLSAQGTPSAVFLYSSETEWHFGSSTVTFSNDNNVVIGYYESPLGNELNTFVGNLTLGSKFQIGSSKQQVISAQGTPSAVFFYSSETEWHFGSSTVTFSNDNNVVTEYYESPLGDELNIGNPAEPTASLYAPSPGETLTAGGTYHIQWDASNIDRIRLEYQTVRAGTWYPVVANISAADQSFDWVVPDIDSGTCMMRITTLDGAVLDITSGTFSIRPGTIGTLVLNAPAGGESWAAGSAHDIAWETNLSAVTIWYSVDGGTTWKLVVENYSTSTSVNSEVRYTWTVPASPSTNCYIKITDEFDTDIADINTSPFTITSQAYTPEMVFRHETGYPIYLSSPAIDGDGVIYITNRLNGLFAIRPDGGRKWATYFDDSSLTGSTETWVSPVVAGDRLYVGSGNGYLYALDRATGAIIWRYNAKSAIYAPPAISYDGNIYFGTADGTFIGLKPDSSTLFTPRTTGGGIFTSPAIGMDGTVYLGGLDGTLYAYTSGGALRWSYTTGLDRIISSPAIGTDGTVYVATSGDQATGSAAGYLFAITADGSYKWDSFIGTTIVSSPAIGTDGTIYIGSQYYHSASSTFSGYVTAVDPKDGSLIWDNPFDFDVESSPLVASDGTVYIGTTVLMDNDTYTGRLYALSPSDGNVKWSYQTDGAVTSSPALGTGGVLYFGTGDGGLYALKGPSSVTLADSGWPKYRQNTANTGRVAGTANAFVRVAKPNGGENFLPGSTVRIVWAWRNVTNILIELSTDGGGSFTQIAQVAASDSSYTWQVPGTINSANCLIRLSDTQNSAITDICNGLFTISQQSFLEVTAPAGGEEYQIGSTRTIGWTANAVSAVTLAYSTDGGENWIQIAADVDASTGQYQWTVPDAPSTNCRVKVSDATDGTVFDITDGAFSIVSSTFIQVTAPKFGDIWSAGSKRTIKWEFNGPTTVKIDLSVDNGITWQTIIASTPALTGSYIWTVPEVAKPNCFIRITDTGNTATSSTSARFEIVTPELSITHSPVTSSVENEPITFTAHITSTSAIDEVKLLYDVTGSRRFILNALDMTPIGDDTYRVTLQEGVFTAQGIEYYIWAKDASNRTTRSPDQHYYSITADISDIKSTETLTGGSAANAYRMVSIPLDLDALTISGQLTNALLPGEHGADWRLFWFDPALEAYDEYIPGQHDLSGFVPGKVFWLISKNDFRLTAPHGTTVSTSESYTITLKAGWNDIANPWMFNISWDDIENPSGADLSVLYEYDGSWSNPLAPPTELEPWKGYAVKNNTNMNVVIKLQPTPAGASRIVEAIQQAGKQTATGDASWIIALEARAGEASDIANYLGVRPGASTGHDRFDHPEPPPVGDSVALSFPHKDDQAQTTRYTVDMRPPSEGPVQWAFDVTTIIPEEIVTVTLSGLDALPHETGIAIQDRDTGELVPIHDDMFNFLSAGSPTERHFLLTVDNAEAMERNGLTPGPVEFLSASNYPNPFNPSTTIRYALPDSGPVRIRVFNVLGQQIEQFDIETHEAGIHEFYFDASNLTSGIYFYRVEAGGSAVTGKMLYLK